MHKLPGVWHLSQGVSGLPHDCVTAAAKKVACCAMRMKQRFQQDLRWPSSALVMRSCRKKILAALLGSVLTCTVLFFKLPGPRDQCPPCTLSRPGPS